MDQRTEETKICCIIAQRTAYEQIGYMVKTDRIDLPDLDSLIAMFDISFGNKHQEMEAKRKTKVIGQGNRDFAAYYVEFQRYASELEWKEKAKLSPSKNGTSYEIKNVLLGREIPNRINAYVELCNDIDGKQKALQYEQKYQRRGNNASGSSTSRHRYRLRGRAQIRWPLQPRERMQDLWISAQPTGCRSMKETVVWPKVIIPNATLSSIYLKIVPRGPCKQPRQRTALLTALPTSVPLQGFLDASPRPDGPAMRQMTESMSMTKPLSISSLSLQSPHVSGEMLDGNHI